VPTGYLPADKFTVARLRERMQRLLPCAEGPVKLNKDKQYQPAPGEEYMNWVYVPGEYDSTKPMGMVLQLHGGAGGSPQSAAAAYLQSQGFVMMDLLRGHDFITVCAGTPPMAPSKWSFPESETHLQSVIEEYSTRYNIDPDRIYLMGGSMGGIGCWWHALRESDRFAIIAPMAGTWQTAYWPRLRGTLLYLVSGAFDHHTHVDFHRYAHQRMTELNLAHFDAEYIGAHARTNGRPQIEALFELIRITKRDPYTPRVCAISPFAVSDARRFPRQPHTFWASVLDAGPDGVPVECAARNANRIFAPARQLMKAGAVDAENLGENRFRVKATNVRRFALWLHPKMGVDFSKPLQIEVLAMGVDPETKAEFERGRKTITTAAKPSLGAMLEYLGDRRDHGLIYQAAVEIVLAEDDGQRQARPVPLR
jgi:pimeloyl-ACP methyl ester carboxylesterase